MHGERRDFFRPDYPLGVREFFDEHADKACDADTVRAHPHRHHVSFFVFYRELHIRRFLLSKIENVTDLGGAYFLQILALHTEIGERLIVQHFFIDCDSLRTIEIDHVLAGFTDRLEFVAEFRERTARSECDEGVIADAKAFEDIHVRRLGRFVVCQMRALVGRERIHIFHHELASAHDAALGAQLVAQLGLKLIDRYRQVLVTRDKILHHLRNRLFVAPAKADLSARLEFRLEPHIDDLVAPAIRLLPQFFPL